ncbi:hypothetical protein [Undibacterium sp. SXout7W]
MFMVATRMTPVVSAIANDFTCAEPASHRSGTGVRPACINPRASTMAFL